MRNYSSIDVDQLIKAPECFASLLNSKTTESSAAQTVVTGTIVRVETDYVLVDVGLKSEGNIPRKEFSDEEASEIKVGDPVDVYVVQLDGPGGQIELSREKARRETTLAHLEQAHKNGTKVLGKIFGRVKGGFTVDLSGIVAFLPGSQLDVRPVNMNDVDAMMNQDLNFIVLKMDWARGNIVVSRRVALEDLQAGARDKLLETLEKGSIIQGIVKNITDYGAFVDLGGFDGLLHVTDISWKRIDHPKNALTVGQEIKVVVIKYNKETKRISLGMKQLEPDPWSCLGQVFVAGTRHSGRITNVTDYGAFVEVVPGVEGLVHVSEISWTRKNLSPHKVLSVGQEIDVFVLEFEPEKRRIALGIKQCEPNPWEKLVKELEIGSLFEGEIRNITDFGLFVRLTQDIDGLVHMSDLSWDVPGEKALQSFKKGEKITVKILEIDVARERVVLGVKQIAESNFLESAKDLKKNQIVTGEIAAIHPDELHVILTHNILGTIRIHDLARDPEDRRTNRFAVGEKIDALVVSVDRKTQKVFLSIRAREIAEEKEAVEKYGSTDSGASLGSILSAALEKKKEKTPKKSEVLPKNEEKNN